MLATPAGERVGSRIASPNISIHAPHLVDLEVAQALRRYVRQGSISGDRAATALGHLDLLDLMRYPHAALLPRIWALRENLTAYDAAYVALAEALGATLLTTDRRLAKATGVVAAIELLA